MTLPSAAPHALWGGHFLRGSLSPDALIDHCGPEALSVLKQNRGGAIELVVVAPGDLSGVVSPAHALLLEAGSGLFLRSASLLALPDWSVWPASRGASTTRNDAERLLNSAYEMLSGHFAASAAFGITRPYVPEIAFPDDHPSRLRQLWNRAATAAAIVDELKKAWTTTMDEDLNLRVAVNELAFAARRGFEAASTI